MNQATEFAEVFGRFGREERTGETTQLGGANVRLVKMAGGGEGR